MVEDWPYLNPKPCSSLTPCLGDDQENREVVEFDTGIQLEGFKCEFFVLQTTD